MTKNQQAMRNIARGSLGHRRLKPKAQRRYDANPERERVHWKALDGVRTLDYRKRRAEREAAAKKSAQAVQEKEG